MFQETRVIILPSKVLLLVIRSFYLMRFKISFRPEWKPLSWKYSTNNGASGCSSEVTISCFLPQRVNALSIQPSTLLNSLSTKCVKVLFAMLKFIWASYLYTERFNLTMSVNFILYSLNIVKINFFKIYILI